MNSIFCLCFLVTIQGSLAYYILPEFSIEKKDDLDNSTIELVLVKSRSQTFKRDKISQVLTNKEKTKFAAILNASRYGRDDPMYWNGPIASEYKEIGYIDISNPSGINSRYWFKVTKDLINWRLTTNKESFSSTIAGLYFDESGEIASFVAFERVESLNYLHVPFFRWIFYLAFGMIIIVVIRKRKKRKQEKQMVREGQRGSKKVSVPNGTDLQ